MIFVVISQNLIKSPLKFWFTSRISVHDLWHVSMYSLQFSSILVLISTKLDNLTRILVYLKNSSLGFCKNMDIKKKLPVG